MRKNTLFIGLSVILLTGCGDTGENTLSKHVFKLAATQEILLNSMACHTIVDVSVFQDGPESEGEITAKVTKGSDNIAVKIYDESISIITGAAVKNGTSEPEKWTILSNTPSHLMAANVRESVFGTSIYTFTLNKKTGLAVWNKGTPTLLYIDVPEGFTQFLQCT